MRIVRETLALLNMETGEVAERVLEHEGEQVREFYSGAKGERDRFLR